MTIRNMLEKRTKKLRERFSAMMESHRQNKDAAARYNGVFMSGPLDELINNCRGDGGPRGGGEYRSDILGGRQKLSAKELAERNRARHTY
jgi:hypothetical protein